MRIDPADPSNLGNAIIEWVGRPRFLATRTDARLVPRRGCGHRGLAQRTLGTPLRSGAGLDQVREPSTRRAGARGGCTARVSNTPRERPAPFADLRVGSDHRRGGVRPRVGLVVVGRRAGPHHCVGPVSHPSTVSWGELVATKHPLSANPVQSTRRNNEVGGCRSTQGRHRDEFRRATPHEHHYGAESALHAQSVPH